MSLTGATGAAPIGTETGSLFAAMNTARADRVRVDAHLEKTATAGPDKRNDTLKASRPIAIKPEFDAFPAELKPLPNWVCWRYSSPKSDGKKPRKIPFQPDGHAADTTDPSTWRTFEACRAAYLRGGFDGIGFVFDGAVGPDGLCYCGVDVDDCIGSDKKIQSIARNRIKRLGTYTEISPSGAGLHCIARAKPLERLVKFDGVEVYSTGRYFTFTGACILGKEIKAAPAEVAALVNEVRANEAAAKQALRDCSFTDTPHNFEIPKNFKGPAAAFASLDATADSLADGIRSTHWFDSLLPNAKDEIVDLALAVIARNTTLLELEANGGNNAEYYKLTTAVARSGAPRAEDIFVKHASAAKDADTEDELRRYFTRCRAGQTLGQHGITVGTLLHVAQQNGANFDKWWGQAPPDPETARSASWDPADLKVSFSNIPHRKWLYGWDLIRGEVTLEAGPGGAGKTAHATAMAVAVATGVELLDEKIYKDRDLKVLYINGEDSRIEMSRRVLASCMAHADKIPVQPPDRLFVAGADDACVGQMNFLRTTNKTFEIDRTGFEALEAIINSVQPDLVVLDPLIVFCGGADINGNGLMALVLRELKHLATKFNCAVLVVHHTRKGGVGNGGNAEDISGASAIVNLARKAIMPVTMTEDEAKKFLPLPSERLQYFKLVDAKTNFTPRAADSPWYQLHNVTLVNNEPPVYPTGDGVQAVRRINLSVLQAAPPTPADQKIQDAILDLVDRGKMIEGQSYPYSPSLAGAKNARALLDDAMEAVATATAPQQWNPVDLKAVIQRTITQMTNDGSLFEEQITKGRFRNRQALRANRSRRSGVDSDGAPLGDPAPPDEDDLPERQ
jgi:hypothetical protein